MSDNAKIQDDVQRIEDWVDNLQRSVQLMAAYLRQGGRFAEFADHNIRNWEVTAEENESMTDEDKINAKAQYTAMRGFLIGP